MQGISGAELIDAVCVDAEKVIREAGYKCQNNVNRCDGIMHADQQFQILLWHRKYTMSLLPYVHLRTVYRIIHAGLLFMLSMTSFSASSAESGRPQIKP